jgi:hypothetical protein
VYGSIPPVAVDPFLTISVKDIGFVGEEVGMAVVVWVELGAFPAIFCIWVDIWSIFSLMASNFFYT